MSTLQKAPTALELAEIRYHNAQDEAIECPGSDSDEWLFWSKVHYEQELHKEAKREAAILKDLNSADQNQGRLPHQTKLSEGLVNAVCLIASTAAFGWFLYWLVTHSVVAR